MSWTGTEKTGVVKLTSSLLHFQLFHGLRLIYRNRSLLPDAGGF